jgi:hypothetical protein
MTKRFATNIRAALLFPAGALFTETLAAENEEPETIGLSLHDLAVTHG